MGPLTRRRALQCATALLPGIAGCTDSSTTIHRDRSPPDDVRLDVPTFFLRNPAGRPFVHVSHAGSGDSDGTPRPRGGIISERPPDTALTFTADVPGTADARRFVRRTDFDRESVFVTHDSVGACFQLEFCYVGWSDTEVVAAFRERYRDADVACEADRRHTVAAFVRIPDTLEEAVVRERDSRSGDRCRLPTSWQETPPRMDRGGAGGPGSRRGG